MFRVMRVLNAYANLMGARRIQYLFLHPIPLSAHAVWLYFRFPLSLRIVEEMLLERGIVVSYETIRRWAPKFGADYARRLKPKVQSGRDVWRSDPQNSHDFRPKAMPRSPRLAALFERQTRPSSRNSVKADQRLTM